MIFINEIAVPSKELEEDEAMRFSFEIIMILTLLLYSINDVCD